MQGTSAMDIFNDFDLYQEALKKVNLDEAAMPVVRGIVVEDIDTYNKIQRLLNTPALEPCHRFLYNLDVEQLTEDEVNKVNNLYKLGQDRGFIPLDEPDDLDNGNEDSLNRTAADQTEDVSKPQLSLTQPQASFVQAPSDSAFTVAYSAIKDGMMKTGEAYSNAVSTRAAKADVISKLQKAGYNSIEILCIEAGDPDMRNCSNTYCAQQMAADTSIYEKDDNSDSKDKSDDKASKQDGKSDDKSDDKGNEESNQPADKDDNKKEDADNKDDSKKDDADGKDSKKEDAKEPDEKLNDKSDDKAEDATNDKEEKELSAEEKTALKDSYKKAFKAAMIKCKFETSFSELSLEDKVKFFTELSKAWGNKADPCKFMTDKEVDQLEKIVVKPNE